jgi:hypothetical protein
VHPVLVRLFLFIVDLLSIISMGVQLIREPDVVRLFDVATVHNEIREDVLLLVFFLELHGFLSKFQAVVPTADSEGNTNELLHRTDGVRTIVNVHFRCFEFVCRGMVRTARKLNICHLSR